MAEDAAQRGDAAQVGDRRHTAELEGEANRVVGDERHRKGGDVHHHHVAGVFGPGQARHEEGEADLHEQDQEAGDEQPDEVDGDMEVTGFAGELIDPHLGDRHAFGPVAAGGRLQEVSRGAGFESAGVTVVVGQSPNGNQRDERQER